MERRGSVDEMVEHLERENGYQDSIGHDVLKFQAELFKLCQIVRVSEPFPK